MDPRDRVALLWRPLDASPKTTGRLSTWHAAEVWAGLHDRCTQNRVGEDTGETILRICRQECPRAPLRWVQLMSCVGSDEEGGRWPTRPEG